MASTEKPTALPKKLASTDSKPIPLTKLGFKIMDNDIKPPKKIKNKICYDFQRSYLRHR